MPENKFKNLVLETRYPKLLGNYNSLNESPYSEQTYWISPCLCKFVNILGYINLSTISFGSH